MCFISTALSEKLIPLTVTCVGGVQNGSIWTSEILWMSLVVLEISGLFFHLVVRTSIYCGLLTMAAKSNSSMVTQSQMNNGHVAVLCSDSLLGDLKNRCNCISMLTANSQSDNRASIYTLV